MGLKILGSCFRCKVANKCLNIQRGIKSFQSFPLLSCESLAPMKKTLIEQIAENLDDVENGNFM